MNLKEKLDRIFSEYIRLRDTDSSGYGKCISCGKIIRFEDGDAGHYVNRKHLSLRYDEKNVNLQCRSCNRFDEGNMIGYNHGLVEKYGDSVISYLTIKKFNICKIGKFEYEALIKYYKQRIKEIKQQKNIQYEESGNPLRIKEIIRREYPNLAERIDENKKSGKR